MKPLLVVAALLALSCPARAGGCAPLLTDPRGDTTALPSVVDDPGATDLLTADLRVTRTDVVATVRVLDLPEAGTVASHEWGVGFTANEQRYRLVAHDNLHEQRFEATHLVSGADVPEDSFGSAFEWAGDGTGSIDVSRDTVTVKVPLTVFQRFGGVSGRLTQVRATSATGLGYPTGEVYEGGDLGRTERSYLAGSRC